MRPDDGNGGGGNGTTPAPARSPVRRAGPEIPYDEGMGVRAAGAASGGGLGASRSGTIDRDDIAARLAEKPDDPEVIAEALAALGLYSGRTSGFTAETAPPQLTAAYQRVWRDIGSPQGSDADDRIISAIMRRLQPGRLTAASPVEGWTRY